MRVIGEGRVRACGGRADPEDWLTGIRRSCYMATGKAPTVSFPVAPHSPIAAPTNCQRFAAAHGPEALVELLRRHSNTPSVVARACIAIRYATQLGRCVHPSRAC